MTDAIPSKLIELYGQQELYKRHTRAHTYIHTQTQTHIICNTRMEINNEKQLTCESYEKHCIENGRYRHYHL